MTWESTSWRNENRWILGGLWNLGWSKALIAATGLGGDLGGRLFRAELVENAGGDANREKGERGDFAPGGRRSHPGSVSVEDRQV